jgi:hypothetical protein
MAIDADEYWPAPGWKTMAVCFTALGSVTFIPGFLHHKNCVSIDACTSALIAQFEPLRLRAVFHRLSSLEHLQSSCSTGSVHARATLATALIKHPSTTIESLVMIDDLKHAANVVQLVVSSHRYRSPNHDHVSFLRFTTCAQSI